MVIREGISEKKTVEKAVSSFESSRIVGRGREQLQFERAERLLCALCPGTRASLWKIRPQGPRSEQQASLERDA